MAARNATLPNPFTPMAFFKPSTATKATNQNYAAVGSLAGGNTAAVCLNFFNVRVCVDCRMQWQVLLWDIIYHTASPPTTRYRINRSFIIYCIARWVWLYPTFPGDWSKSQSDLSCLFARLRYHDKFVNLFTVIMHANIFISCSSRQLRLYSPNQHIISIYHPIVPFVMRVSALYNNNKYAIVLLSVSWLSVLGSCIAVPIGATGFNIGTTKYCLDAKTKTANALALFWPFIHDSLIVVARHGHSWEAHTLMSTWRIVWE
jgi:hypothetical protein